MLLFVFGDCFCLVVVRLLLFAFVVVGCGFCLLVGVVCFSCLLFDMCL